MTRSGVAALLVASAMVAHAHGPVVGFIERGGRDEVTRVYDAAAPGALPSAQSATAPTSPAKPPPTQGAAPTRLQPPQAAPASGDRADTPMGPQRADAELKGITTLGVVVEELSSQAAACGLVRDTIEAAVSTIMTDAGFKVARNSDEDTYLYVNVITTSASSSLCVSRFDASLYSHTTARLSYQDAPLLVQVLLLHQGGLAGGGPREHADSVLRNVRQYVESVRDEDPQRGPVASWRTCWSEVGGSVHDTRLRSSPTPSGVGRDPRESSPRAALAIGMQYLARDSPNPFAVHTRTRVRGALAMKAFTVRLVWAWASAPAAGPPGRDTW